MADTFGSALERLKGVVARQVEGYRHLLDSTRAGNEALRTRDIERFDEILAAQVETLGNLKVLEGERREVLRDVGDGSGHGDIVELREDLAALIAEVSRAHRVQRLVIERNGALVEARLALHRRAGKVPENAPAGIRRIA